MRKIYLIFNLFCMVIWMRAQIPADYYAAANGTKAANLKTALYTIVNEHVERSYNDLWEDFKTTDCRSDGKVWDMYSGVTNYVFGSAAQGANYKVEGDAYNREHSFPKSWFAEGKPMYTDLFHLYPTDGYVNGRRSNYPFGETDGDRWQSAEGFSKLGTSTLPGYTGVVFEPADEYKGDFARTYFYMVTAYEDQVAGWESDMLDGTDYPALSEWALEMLLRWADNDPVSQKEVDRNNAVYAIQQNRNPYIDFPGLEQYVWGSRRDEAFSPDSYEGAGGVPSARVAPPQFSPAAGLVEKGTVVEISCTTPNAIITYSLSGSEPQSGTSPQLVSIDRSTTITAHAELDGVRSAEVSATYTVSELPGGETGNGDYVLVSTTDQLEAGARYIIVCEEYSTALSAPNIAKADFRDACDVVLNAHAYTGEVDMPGQPYTLTLGGTVGAYTLHDETADGYVALTTDGNKLYLTADATAESALWNITFDAESGAAQIYSVAYPERLIQYNASSPRFAAYKGTQRSVQLYRRQQGMGIGAIATDGNAKVDVFSADGRLVRRGVRAADALKALPAGIYVVNGRKHLVN